MKIGEIIICTKTTDSNIKDNFYQILRIEPNKITVTVEDETYYNDIPIISRSFYVEYQIDEWSKFNEYFSSVKYLRKTKLLNINNIKDEIYDTK